MTKKLYDTDLSDQEWAQLDPYFSKHRTYKWSKRELVNATLYMAVNGGCTLMTSLPIQLSGVSFVVPRRAVCGILF